MTKRWTVFVSLMLGVATMAGSHDVWLVDRGDRLELLYGHETPEVYNPAKVHEVEGYDASGQSVTVGRVPMDDAFALQKSPALSLVTIVFDNGYWVQASTSSEMKNVSKETAQSFPQVHHPIKYHKLLLSWSERWKQPRGLPLEIVPKQDPFTMKVPGTLRVQVLANGKPLSNATVEYGIHGDAAPKISADVKGFAQVPIEKPGEVFMAVDYAPVQPSSGTTLSYATSLRYELK